MSKQSAHPHEGGSYTIDESGKRTRVAFTAAEAPVPVPVSAAATEPAAPVATDKDNKRKERSS